METIAFESLSSVVGGANAAQKWDEIREAAQPHCPKTVEKFADAPTNRKEAQKIGDACLLEMGSFKAALGGRKKIQDGIDAAFPK